MRTTLLSLPLMIIPSLSVGMTVVADHGGIPAAAFYEHLNVQGQAVTDRRAPGRPQTTRVGIEQMLPVMSQLTPGPVETKQVRLATLPAPLFIVGADSRSLAWLQQNSSALQSLQAIGWAVNVRDQASLERIKATVPGLGVVPMHIDDFAARIGLQHYPVLITRDSVEQ
ncbi:integrating conjugative element protein [Ectopseudomonas toyotomiensis]|uniref:integrating conjugative element protein n=1 Tax=Ectopseudomonas toyotomiensis TaxID=554344 RepID=UPI003D12DABC